MKSSRDPDVKVRKKGGYTVEPPVRKRPPKMSSLGDRLQARRPY